MSFITTPLLSKYGDELADFSPISGDSALYSEGVDEFSLTAEETKYPDEPSSSNWVDITEVIEALKQFQKSANEVMIHERRMEAAFEDIAHGVGRYFEVG